VAVATAAIYPLAAVAPPVALSVVYLPAVLVISAYWGLALGLLTSLASAAAFNFFHIPPVGRFTIADGRDWVALAVRGYAPNRDRLDKRAPLRPVAGAARSAA
jgi:two-component system sensor histidine kinase KdpD